MKKKNVDIVEERLVVSKCRKCGYIESEVWVLKLSSKVGDVWSECGIKKCEGDVEIVRLWKREVVLVRSEGKWEVCK